MVEIEVVKSIYCKLKALFFLAISALLEVLGYDVAMSLCSPFIVINRTSQ